MRPNYARSLLFLLGGVNLGSSIGGIMLGGHPAQIIFNAVAAIACIMVAINSPSKI